ncbi:MAG TPA: 1-acyl-sn-glycerol-3-phosphate acyltransferase [Kofleriaceae bacterium]|jgi:glycerol-3-phosphate O-acyltransferase/dihydroxyacetone phosphate acyltransferase|nr:1-acyl-sn-glycerol-3-phosphate acyltransferase [Kofleriaceae bacterium]
MLRRALVATFRGIIRLYFREIERVGEPPAKDTRGRVFVSNHHNALIDPVLVLTDAECEISPIAKSTLWKIPGLKYLLDGAGAVPLYRRKDDPNRAADANDEVFSKIADHLAHGGNILIFPEGTSHSQPHLAPLRTGAARMLVAGEKEGGSLTFQAVALEFDEREQFRSRCLVLWGPVRTLDEVAGDGEERVRAITEQMEADLSSLLVSGETHDDRRLVARVAEMLANDAGDQTLSGWSTLGRQVEAAGEMLRMAQPQLVGFVRDKVEAYFAELARLGRTDAQIAQTLGATTTPKSPTRWIGRIALAPLAIPGFVLYGLPYFIPRMIARSSDPDARSTIKLGAALVVYPVWMATLVGASFVFIPPPLSFVAAGIAIASPFAALRWLDAYWNRAPDRELTPDETASLARSRIAARTAIDEARARLA